MDLFDQVVTLNKRPVPTYMQSSKAQDLTPRFIGHGRLTNELAFVRPQYSADIQQVLKNGSTTGTFFDFFYPVETGKADKGPRLSRKKRRKISKTAYYLNNPITRSFGASVSDGLGKYKVHDHVSVTGNEELFKRTFQGVATAMPQLVVASLVNNKYTLLLPVAIDSLGYYINKVADEATWKALDYEDRIGVLKDIEAKVSKEYGLKLLSPAHTITSDLIQWSKFASSATDKTPQLDAFLKNYVKGVRIKAIPSTGNHQLSLDALSREDYNLDDQYIVAQYNTHEAAVLRTLQAFIEVEIGTDELAYYCQTPADKVKPSHVLQVFHKFYSSYNNGTLSKAVYIHPLSNVFYKNAKYKARPRSNAEGFCVDANNNLFYVPVIDDISSYSTQLDTVVKHPTDGTYSFANVDSSVSNRLVYTDWVNNKLVYTQADGSIAVLDMETFYPVKSHAVVAFLAQKCIPFSDNDDDSGDSQQDQYLELIDSCVATYTRVSGNKVDFSKYIAEVTPELNNFMDAITNGIHGGKLASPYHKLRDVVKIFDNLKMRIGACGNLSEFIDVSISLGKVLSNALETDDWDIIDRGGLPGLDKTPIWISRGLGYEDMVLNSLNPFGHVARMVLDEVGDYISKDVAKFVNSAGQSVPNTLTQIGCLLLARAYGGRKVEFEAYDADERAPYDPAKKIDPNYKPEFKNIADERSFRYHQYTADNQLRDVPPNAFLAVDAGGGKTILAVTDMVRALDKGVCKRPVVLCPAHLVKDYVGEINYFTDGKVNSVVLDNVTLAEYGEEELLKLVRAAPINTIFISSYNTTSIGLEASVYANVELEESRYIHFFRECEFDGVWMDESHYMKAKRSKRTRMTRLMVSEIPIKRMMTGTFAPNTLRDVVRQIAFFDPTIFGDEKQFMRKYFYYTKSKTTGKRVRLPRPGAEAEIMRLINKHVQFIQIQRKEWAAFLPSKVETFYPATLTPNQVEVYKLIITKTLEEMAQKSPGLIKALSKMDVTSTQSSDEDGEDSEDDGDGDDDDMDEDRIYDALDKHLTAVESFLSAPMSNELGRKLLTAPEDQVSPKGKAINNIIRQHLSSKQPGKILVFANWDVSVKEIYEAFDPDIQAATVVYHATDKVKLTNQFKTDESKRVMIGISRSLEEGLNLQYCSRLIRAESPWTPGMMEQGMARVLRPNYKEAETRDKIFIDHVVADGTVDITKASRLIAKTVSVSKLYNYKDSRYQQLSELEPLKLSLENIQAWNDWSTLSDYLEAFKDMRILEKEDFDEYANQYPERKVPVPVTNMGNMQNSLLLKNIPYTLGMPLFGADSLGIIPFTQWETKLEQEGKNPDDYLDGLMVHTEYGDGTAVARTDSTVRFDFYEGGRTSVKKDKAFVITKKLTSTAEIRSQIAQLVGDIPVLENTLLHPGSQIKKDKAAERKAVEDKKQQDLELLQPKNTRRDKNDPTPTLDDEENYGVELFITMINEMLALVMSSEDPDVEARAFKPYGFRPVKPYLYAHVTTTAQLDDLLNKLEKAFPEIQPKYLDVLNNLYNEFSNEGKRQKLKVDHHYTSTDIKNFFDRSFRPVTNVKELRPYPVIVNGQLFICVDVNSQHKQIPKLKASVKTAGVVWKEEHGDLRCFITRKTEIKQIVSMLKADGYIVMNEAELKKQYTAITGKV